MNATYLMNTFLGFGKACNAFMEMSRILENASKKGRLANVANLEKYIAEGIQGLEYMQMVVDASEGENTWILMKKQKS